MPSANVRLNYEKVVLTLMKDNKMIILAVAVIAVIAALAASIVIYNDSDADKSFVIIHTNDSHCHYSGDNCGFETVAALKEQYSKDSIVFTIDAGDYIQGSPMGPLTKGAASIEIMNSVQYDLGIPGNHEFDYGLASYLEVSKKTTYPIICANMVYKDTGKSVFEEYKVLEKGNVKVGFFGLLTEETVESVKQEGIEDVRITDPIEAAERMVAQLKSEKVDYIVCVGHIGVVDEGFKTSDQICNEVKGIDIFIDGHSHTEMEDGKVCDGSKELLPSDTVIASTGQFLENVGVIKVTNKTISAKLYRGPALENEVVTKTIAKVEAEQEEILKKKIGETEVELEGTKKIIRNNETNLGDFVTDVMRIKSGADIAIINSGALRASIPVGDVTNGSVYAMMPYLNTLVLFEVPGSVLWDAMKQSFAQKDDGGFLQFSGMTVTYKAVDGGYEIVSITKDGKEIDKDATYKLAATDYLAGGGDGHEYFTKYKGQEFVEINYSVIDYITEIGTITESTIQGGRLVEV